MFNRRESRLRVLGDQPLSRSGTSGGGGSSSKSTGPEPLPPPDPLGSHLLSWLSAPLGHQAFCFPSTRLKGKLGAARESQAQ